MFRPRVRITKTETHFPTDSLDSIYNKINFITNE